MGLVTVFIIDPLDPSTVSTPFLLGIILMGLSLRQGVGLVASVSVLYGVLTIYALIHFHHMHAVATGIRSPHPAFWLFQRMGLFVVLCGLAIYLAFYRTDMDRVLTRLRAILASCRRRSCCRMRLELLCTRTTRSFPCCTSTRRKSSGEVILSLF